MKKTDVLNLLKVFEGTITLIGSTRFHKDYQDANRMLTLLGNKVFSCGHFGNSIHRHLDQSTVNERCKVLHFNKISDSDLVVLVRPDYIGNSTQKEISYTLELGLPIIQFVEGDEDDYDRFEPFGDIDYTTIEPIKDLTSFTKSEGFRRFVEKENGHLGF